MRALPPSPPLFVASCPQFDGGAPPAVPRAPLAFGAPPPASLDSARRTGTVCAAPRHRVPSGALLHLCLHRRPHLHPHLQLHGHRRTEAGTVVVVAGVVGFGGRGLAYVAQRACDGSSHVGREVARHRGWICDSEKWWCGGAKSNATQGTTKVVSRNKHTPGHRVRLQPHMI